MANTVIGASVQVEFSSVGELRKTLQDATQRAKDLKKQFGETSDEFKNAQQDVDKLKTTLDGLNLKRQLKDANLELVTMQEKFGATSKEAIAAAQKVAGLKDQIEDARETADLFDPGKKFQAFVTLGSQIAAGFSAVQGAMALVGAESEDVQKALLKVQGAMALAQGLSQLKDFGKSWQQLNVFIKSSTTLTKANAAATALTSTAMKLFGRSVNTTSTSFRVLKTAIVSTGIGALLVILGEAIGALMDFADNTEEAAAADEELKRSEERLAQAIEIKNKALEGTIDALNNVTQLNLLRAKLGGASEEQLTDIERKGIEDRIKLRKEDLDKSSTDQEGYFEMLKKYGNDVNELEKFNLNAQIKARDEANRRSQSSNNDALQKRREAEDKRKQIIQQAIEAEKQANEDLIKYNLSSRDKELYDLTINYEKQKKVIEAGGKSSVSLTELYNKQKDEINKKYAEEQRKREIDFQNQINELKQRLNSNFALSEQEEARQAVIDKYAKEREELLNQYPNNLALMVLLKQNEEAELSNIDKSFEEKRRQQRNENNRLRIESEKAFAAELLAVETELQNQKYNVVNGGLDLLQQLSGKNEKIANVFFAIQKAIEIGRIITSTASSIALVKAQTAAIPAILPPGIPNPAYFTAVALNAKRIASLKIGAGVSIAQIAAASISKFKSGGQSPSGGGQNEPPPPGNLNAPMQPGLSPAVQGQALNAQAINDLGNQSLRAYVMNSDIQNNNQRNAYLERNARIG